VQGKPGEDSWGIGGKDKVKEEKVQITGNTKGTISQVNK
jgi:hypothetical protein